MELYDGRIVPASFGEERSSLSSSTREIKLFVTATVPAVLPHIKVLQAIYANSKIAHLLKTMKIAK